MNEIHFYKDKLCITSDGYGAHFAKEFLYTLQLLEIIKIKTYQVKRQESEGKYFTMVGMDGLS